MENRSRVPGFQKSFSVILAGPENPENVGLVARSMKNTGFEDLRVVGITNFKKKTYLSAVHSHDILDSACFFPGVSDAVCDLDVIFAATAKQRKNFTSISLDEAVEKMCGLSGNSRIGLLFGNERTGLTSEELLHSNFLFSIPQHRNQPSYNLAAAVLVTLFSLFRRGDVQQSADLTKKVLSRQEQEKCLGLILEKLEEIDFIHDTNKKHVNEIVFDIFGRLTMTEKDKNFLLAIFSKI
jgi:tRNA/rRNA methyltransferase